MNIRRLAKQRRFSATLVVVAAWILLAPAHAVLHTSRHAAPVAAHGPSWPTAAPAPHSDACPLCALTQLPRLAGSVFAGQPISHSLGTPPCDLPPAPLRRVDRPLSRGPPDA